MDRNRNDIGHKYVIIKVFLSFDMLNIESKFDSYSCKAPCNYEECLFALKWYPISGTCFMNLQTEMETA